ncbi:HEAT repeat domain-containing protein [uncultured Williamsia sp.]|uniref:HEAT repeat domain-containing protein n=1 Tax=uncultured Williamsia sp. TaxID=259311 RepID=UPI0026370B89|nr:HEAT repeat domain-containing protein [uncultured Williamsia sp.]
MTPTLPVITALQHRDPSARLRAAMHLGANPDPSTLDAIVRRCAVEPDFFVRDMLTWAVTRHPASVTVPRLITELDDDLPQARSQALHTLTKIPGSSATPGLWPRVLHLVDDPDDEVATTAWRAAVALVPEGHERALVDALLRHLGRGDLERQRRLTRALVALAWVADDAVRGAVSSADEDVARHAARTVRVLDDPDAALDDAVDEARRVAAMGPDAHR